MRQLFDVRIACPTGFGLDRSFYLSLLKNQYTPMTFDLRCSGDCFYVLSSKGTKFALLDIQTTRALTELQGVKSLRFEAAPLLSPSDKENIKDKTCSPDQVRSITVNIYGTRDSAGEAGAILTRAGLYLQHPFLLRYGMEYNNPHYFQVPGSKIDINQFVQNRQHGSNLKQNLSIEVTKVLDSLDFVNARNELPPIAAVTTPLLRLVLFWTSFRRHQNSS